MRVRELALLWVFVALVIMGWVRPAAAGTPSISSFSPPSGAIGTQVTIDGTGLDQTTEVTFNGASVAGDFHIVSSTELTARVPKGASTGPIGIVTTAGQATSGIAFVVIPISHVVIVLEENHSFDNVLGKFCSAQAHGSIVRVGANASCDGATTGRLADGTTITLGQATDLVPSVLHTPAAQSTAIDGGQMDGFSNISGCRARTGFACYSQYGPTHGPCLHGDGTSGASCIPNLVRLAKFFTISDSTFEPQGVASWAGHMALASTTLDGFLGLNPKASPLATPGRGWGCDSGKVSPWWDGSSYVSVPSCVPNQQGALGPAWTGYTGPRADYVPTIFDRMDAAGLTWKIYGGNRRASSGAYGWTICPTFYECLGSAQGENLVPAHTVFTAAASGALPSLSIVTPPYASSQHNGTSMSLGDNWLGRVVDGLMQGPEWGSTAVFLTYDDCGCFYDHVTPPGLVVEHGGLPVDPGIRVPMIVISPYAKAGFTDSSPATFMGMLAFTEHLFGLPPLSAADANAYDYRNAFDYSQPPLGPVPMVRSPVSQRELAYIARHPTREGAT